MITKYTEYIKEDTNDNTFWINFSFSKLSNTKYQLNYSIKLTGKYVKTKVPIYNYLHNLIDKLIADKFKQDVNNIFLTKQQVIYLIFKLEDLKFNLNNSVKMKSVFNDVKYHIADKFIVINKELDYHKLKEYLKEISLDENDIENFFIYKIKKHNNIYFSKIYRYAFTPKIIDMFKYLNDAKNFDLI